MDLSVWSFFNEMRRKEEGRVREFEREGEHGRERAERQGIDMGGVGFVWYEK